CEVSGPVSQARPSTLACGPKARQGRRCHPHGSSRLGVARSPSLTHQGGPVMHPKTDAHLSTCAICQKRAADAVVAAFESERKRKQPTSTGNASADRAIAIFKESAGAVRARRDEPNFLSPEDVSDNTFKGAGIVITKAQMTEAIKIFKKNMREHGRV